MEKEQEKKYEKKVPSIETKVRVTADGKYIVHETITSDVYPVAYFEKALKTAASKGGESQ